MNNFKLFWHNVILLPKKAHCNRFGKEKFVIKDHFITSILIFNMKTKFIDLIKIHKLSLHTKNQEPLQVIHTRIHYTVYHIRRAGFTCCFDVSWAADVWPFSQVYYCKAEGPRDLAIQLNAHMSV